MPIDQKCNCCNISLTAYISYHASAFYRTQTHTLIFTYDKIRHVHRRVLFEFKSWNSTSLTRNLFHLLYNMARILVSIFLYFPTLKRSCRDSPTDKSFNFEGESIKVFGYQARLRTFKYSGLSLTNLQFRRSITTVFSFGLLENCDTSRKMILLENSLVTLWIRKSSFSARLKFCYAAFKW